MLILHQYRLCIRKLMPRFKSAVTYGEPIMNTKHTALFRLASFIFIFSIMAPLSCLQESRVMVSLVTFHIGDVKIIGAGLPARVASIGDVLCENDTITTGKESEAVIQMGDDVIVNILSDSRVTFVSMMKSANIELKLESGKILNKLGKLKAQREFRVMTKTATASVRGTTFLVFYENNAATVAVGEGAVEVKKISVEAVPEGEIKEKIEEKTEPTIVRKNNTLVIAEEPKAPPVSRTISAVESFYIQKVAAQPVIPKPAKKSKVEIEKIQEEVKPKIKQLDNKINEFYPQSLKKISENYDRIDVIRLYSGKVYEGIIVSRGDKFLVISTPAGRVEIPINKIKYTGIKK